MDMRMEREAGKLTIFLKGRLDTNTTSQMEAQVGNALDGVTELVFNLKELTYISSLGLRAFFNLKREMDERGKMVVCEVKQDILEIFELTGFIDVLDLE